MSGRTEDINEAHIDALAINQTRDRIDRWWKNGGLSWDPMVRLQADILMQLEKDMCDTRRFILTDVW